MKELTQHLKKDDKTEIIAKQQKEFQKVLEGTIQTKRGHRIWKINIETKEVEEAKFGKRNINYALAIKMDMSVMKDLVKKEGFVYIPALNAANALKKFNENPNQEAYYKKKPLMRFF